MSLSEKIFIAVLSVIVALFISGIFQFPATIITVPIFILLWSLPRTIENTFLKMPYNYNTNAKGLDLHFEKKVFSFEKPINHSQKIIFSIAVFMGTGIICYSLSASKTSSYYRNHNIDIAETWYFWLTFIVLQAWIQNKIWNSEKTFKMDIPYFIFKIIRAK